MSALTANDDHFIPVDQFRSISISGESCKCQYPNPHLGANFPGTASVMDTFSFSNITAFMIYYSML
jgi:hypothetical protein